MLPTPLDEAAAVSHFRILPVRVTVASRKTIFCLVLHGGSLFLRSARNTVKLYTIKVLYPHHIDDNWEDNITCLMEGEG
jgi:hypothetical protein